MAKKKVVGGGDTPLIPHPDAEPPDGGGKCGRQKVAARSVDSLGADQTDGGGQSSRSRVATRSSAGLVVCGLSPSSGKEAEVNVPNKVLDEGASATSHAVDPIFGVPAASELEKTSGLLQVSANVDNADHDSFDSASSTSGKECSMNVDDAIDDLKVVDSSPTTEHGLPCSSPLLSLDLCNVNAELIANVDADLPSSASLRNGDISSVLGCTDFGGSKGCTSGVCENVKPSFEQNNLCTSSVCGNAEPNSGLQFGTFDTRVQGPSRLSPSAPPFLRSGSVEAVFASMGRSIPPPISSLNADFLQNSVQNLGAETGLKQHLPTPTTSQNAKKDTNVWIKKDELSFKRVQCDKKEFLSEGVVQLDEDELDQGSKCFENALVGRILGQKVRFQWVQEQLSSKWGHLKISSIQDMGQECFIIIFDNVQDRDFVWNSGPWHVGGFEVGLNHWYSGFRPSTRAPMLVQVWTRLPLLPLDCWTLKSLFKIASAAGEPIRIDKVTADKTRVAFARVCIRCDFTQPLVLGTWVIGKGGKKFFQDFCYEVPLLCTKCGIVGHSLNCADPNPENAEQNSKAECEQDKGLGPWNFFQPPWRRELTRLRPLPPRHINSRGPTTTRSGHQANPSTPPILDSPVTLVDPTLVVLVNGGSREVLLGEIVTNKATLIESTPLAQETSQVLQSTKADTLNILLPPNSEPQNSFLQVVNNAKGKKKNIGNCSLSKDLADTFVAKNPFDPLFSSSQDESNEANLKTKEVGNKGTCNKERVQPLRAHG